MLKVTLATCTLININQDYRTLLVNIRNQQKQTLIEKSYTPKKKNKELVVNLALKISFAKEEKQIGVAIYSGKEKKQQNKIAEFSIDLESLSKNQVEFFKINHSSMAKITVESYHNRCKMPEFKATSTNDTEAFIQKRQKFLKTLLSPSRKTQLLSSTPQGSAFTTPQFTKGMFCSKNAPKAEIALQQQPPSQGYQQDLTDRIKRLLTKTKKLQEQQLVMQQTINNFRQQEEERQESYRFQQTGPYYSRQFQAEPHQEIKPTSSGRSFFETQARASRWKSPQNIEYHEHYHIYKPVSPDYNRSSRNEFKVPDIETVPCCTNDSQSLSQKQQQCVMNVKTPYKYFLQ